MQKLSDKITGSTLTAAEWDELAKELENIIENLGQVLSGGDLNQLGKAIAGYVANGEFYTDSGSATAYVLTVIGLKQTAPAYTDGFRAVFRADNTNTGASTVNVASLGVKNIYYGGVVLVAGAIVSGTIITIVFDSGNDRFDLVPTLSDYIATDLGWVLGAAAGGSKGAGTINIENGVYDNNIKMYGPTNVSGYLETQNVTIEEKCGGGTPGFDIDAVIGATFESVGPTGSGATNIWTEMNVIPITASYVILKIGTTVSGGINLDEYNVTVDGRKTGSSVSIGVRTQLSTVTFKNSTGVSEQLNDLSTVYLPIDGSRRFDLAYSITGTGAASIVWAVLVGWGE